MIIDAHQHFWKLDKPFDYRWLDTPSHAPIRHDYMPEDLLPHLRASGVNRSIVVQTQHNLDETRWFLELAEHHSYLAGVVGWVDLAGKDCEKQVEEFAPHPKFVGVRHITQDEPDDDFIVRTDVMRGMKVLEKHGVPFDLLFYVKHLKHVPQLAKAFPDLPMVIDHLAKPHIKTHKLDDWLPGFPRGGEIPDVYCKLSGMVTEADWQNWNANDLKPYVHAALEDFRPERLMFGSDWPVCNLAATYEDVKEALAEALGPLTPSERSMIFGGTAAKFYKLAAPGAPSR